MQARVCLTSKHSLRYMLTKGKDCRMSTMQIHTNPWSMTQYDDRQIRQKYAGSDLADMQNLCAALCGVSVLGGAPAAVEESLFLAQMWEARALPIFGLFCSAASCRGGV